VATLTKLESKLAEVLGLAMAAQDAAREVRGIGHGDPVHVASRKGAITLHANVTDRVPPGIVYTTFHHPDSSANVNTTEYSDWATNCPEYKVTAVEVRPGD
jgi:formate dehydrogenase major subunit